MRTFAAQSESNKLKVDRLMSCILSIETSTNVCSVAVSGDGTCLFNREDHSGPNHAEQLGVFVDEALEYIDSRGRELQAVAVSGGPGSYTGLRIGVSMAKGICYGREVSLVSIPTPELLCVPVLLNHDEIEDDALFCPMIDARRMEVYATVYDRSLKTIRPTTADVVDGETYRALLDEHHIYFFGNGSAKCMDIINHPHAHLIEGIEPLAKWMFPLANRQLMNDKVEDVAYYVPFYLKDFVAQQPKKLL